MPSVRAGSCLVPTAICEIPVDLPTGSTRKRQFRMNFKWQRQQAPYSSVRTMIVHLLWCCPARSTKERR